MFTEELIKINKNYVAYFDENDQNINETINKRI